jgi:hypothetical protein
MLGRVLLVSLLVGGSLVPRAARAVDEGEWQAGLTASLTGGWNGSGVFPGGGARLDGRYGVTDALAAWGAVGSHWWPEAGGVIRMSNASAGLSLGYNVISVIPYLDLGIALAQGGSAGHLGGTLGAGFDYLLDRRWSLGAVARAEWFPISLGGRGDAGTLSLGARLGRSF